ncbi:MAG TPA: M20/M25/M40 family metallo-hydrolase, partial [Erysipelothrix sp.]
FFGKIPQEERPEHTDGYEGFYLLMDLKGNIENATLDFIIRDHDRDVFESRKQLLRDITQEINTKYGQELIKTTISDSYYNMKEVIEKDLSIVELAKEAMFSLNIEPKIAPVRGGTDGSRLSFMGLPTPNLFTGGENFHGPHEFAVVETMVAATKVIVKIAELNASI